MTFHGLKILNVNHLLDPQSGGGTAERTFQLSRFFSLAGAACTLLTLDIGVLTERIRAIGNVRLITLPCVNRRFFVPWVSSSKIDQLVADADIVHLMGHWTVLNALVYRSCRKLKKPFVFCPAGGLKPFGRSLTLKQLYDAVVGCGIVRNASACVAITEEECADFEGYGVTRDRVVVIPNGIDPKDYEICGEPGFQQLRKRLCLPDAPYILFLGRLNKIKGPDLLLDAFVQISKCWSDIHLVFAGPDGGMLQVLRESADQSLVSERVHFIGYIGGAEKTELLLNAKLLAIPSRREAMSIVVLEAGICGTPVLFTRACGLESLSHEEGGSMVEASVEGLTKGLQSILTDEPGANASAKRLSVIVRQQYLWSIQAERYFDLYLRLLAV